MDFKMKLKNTFKSIRFRLFGTLCVSIVLIIFCLIIINNVVLETFYLYSKTSTAIHICQSINSYYNGIFTYNIKDKYPNNVFPTYEEFINNYDKELSVFNDESMNKMISTIEEAKMNMDSVGGIITAAAFNVPAGFGDPFYSSIESRISQSMFAVPAVKGIDFGLGFDFVNYKASECNDAYTIKDNNNIKVVETKTNNNGGILGGISNGMPIIVNVVIKPTPSISKEQLTLNIETKEEETLIIKGRHDPCIAVRAVPVIEAALAIAILDLCIDMKGKLL